MQRFDQQDSVLKNASTPQEYDFNSWQKQPSDDEECRVPILCFVNMLDHLHNSAKTASNQVELSGKLHQYEVLMLDMVCLNQHKNPGFAASPWLMSCPAQLRKLLESIFHPRNAADGLDATSFAAISFSTMLLRTGYLGVPDTGGNASELTSQERGRAFAVFCLVCTKGAWAQTDVVEFIQSYSLDVFAKLSCTLLMAAGKFQVSYAWWPNKAFSPWLAWSHCNCFFDEQSHIMAFEGFALAAAGATRIWTEVRLLAWT